MCYNDINITRKDKMQPNQGNNVPNRPVVTRRPVNARPTTSATARVPEDAGPTFDNGPSIVGSKGGRKTGWILVIILLLLVAAGGVGFGVWAYMDGNNTKNSLNAQIADLQQQNNELQDKLTNTTTIDTDGSENASFGFRKSNADDINGNEMMTVCSGSFTDICYSLSLDGKVSAEFYSVNWEAMGANITEQNKRETEDLSSVIGGTVINITTGHVGNGAFDMVFFLIDDGSVIYMQEEDILSQKYNARVLNGASGIMEIYGNKYNIDCAGFVQDFSGKIRRIIVDNIEDDGTVNLKVE